MAAEWPELAQLASELENLGAVGWRRSSEVRSQADGLLLHIAAVEQCFGELEISAHLRLLNEHLLAGVGSVELVEGGMGVEREIASLVGLPRSTASPAGEVRRLRLRATYLRGANRTVVTWKPAKT